MGYETTREDTKMKKPTKTTTKKVTEKIAEPKQAAKKSTEPKREQTKEVQPSKRDAFNGIIGTRCSNINVAVIEARKKGATVKEVATKTAEDPSLVSAQLCWMFKPKAFLTREKEGKSYRYFVKG